MYMFSITDILFGIGGSSVEYMFPTPDPPYQTICLLRETCIFLFVNMFPIPDKTLKACFLHKTFPIPDMFPTLDPPYWTFCLVWEILSGMGTIVRYRKCLV